MDAVILRDFGPAENLELAQAPDPVPGPGQVLVDAVAHGVHLVDTRLRAGEAGPLPLPRLPAIPGREVAGTVSAVGPGVAPSWIGTAVVAHVGPRPDGGGYARKVAVDEERLHRVPAGPDGATMEPADAIAMIGTGRMAVYTLDIASISAADVVVVTAAAGGLGTLFVQEALRAGARVLALAGGESKLGALRAVTAGTDRIALVDYSAEGWEETARAALSSLDATDGATLVLDGVGGSLGTAATRLLGGRGVLVVHGWASGGPNAFATNAAGAGTGAPEVEVRYAVGPDAPPMSDQRPYQERALAKAASGEWRVLTHRVPFAEAARAHRELEERRTTGKVVLV
ncbi:zinc-binding dehydrogenase [Myceligenerans sp. TRM 65318]|uniref:Zinc-binding dehydrogenase n=2 Tax=Myceligenerans pegani TaxID=2776917 RepID=A0ABR9N523_9MICO|nr:zinc-binding dehydrogenase [Myceligenerans sp. TRM 65318]MBE3020485.1 zinc-binding dehydrogenase [Myceligenerans sp. TRM 65318]